MILKQWPVLRNRTFVFLKRKIGAIGKYEYPKTHCSLPAEIQQCSRRQSKMGWSELDEAARNLLHRLTCRHCNNAWAILVRYLPAPASVAHSAGNGIAFKLCLKAGRHDDGTFENLFFGASVFHMAIHFLPLIEWSNNVFHIVNSCMVESVPDDF